MSFTNGWVGGEGRTLRKLCGNIPKLEARMWCPVRLCFVEITFHEGRLTLVSIRTGHPENSSGWPLHSNQISSSPLHRFFCFSHLHHSWRFSSVLRRTFFSFATTQSDEIYAAVEFYIPSTCPQRSTRWVQAEDIRLRLTRVVYAFPPSTSMSWDSDSKPCLSLPRSWTWYSDSLCSGDFLRCTLMYLDVLILTFHLSRSLMASQALTGEPVCRFHTDVVSSYSFETPTSMQQICSLSRTRK